MMTFYKLQPIPLTESSSIVILVKDKSVTVKSMKTSIALGLNNTKPFFHISKSYQHAIKTYVKLFATERSSKEVPETFSFYFHTFTSIVNIGLVHK